MKYNRGYTLVELIVAVGLFALIMLLASGAYIMMIGLNRQVQGIATGIDNLSFALETMTRDIRTGTAYNCGGIHDCPLGASTFAFKNEAGVDVSYSINGTDHTLQKTTGVTTSALTDPSITINSLQFFAFGTLTGDIQQPRVTIIVSGAVLSPGKPPQPFTVETAATMRGSDL
jgi:prepilin-type N-terminal cleavage/methylation domain-containing protein